MFNANKTPVFFFTIGVFVSWNGAFLQLPKKKAQHRICDTVLGCRRWKSENGRSLRVAFDVVIFALRCDFSAKSKKK